MPNPTTDLVRSYLKEIGRYPLLTPEQEITNARLVQQMMAIEEQRSNLALQLNREPTARELATLLGQTEAEVQSIVQQGQKAKHKMVTANLRLVVSVAKKYQNHNLDFLDLLQEGALGLQRGVEKFDPNKGYKLSTYTYWWITQSITRAIADKSRTIRLPIHINEKLNKIRRIQQQLSQSLGRPPVVAEIAESLNLLPSQIRDYLQVSKSPVSLEMRVGDEGESELVDILPMDSISLDEQIAQELLHQDLSKLLALLKPRQREVLTLRFGLSDNQQLTLSQVAKRLNLSRETIRKTEHQGLKILRSHQNKIKDYLLN
ncbi:RpoD/SigA family RNA polymerase sigma factor [Nostoc sp. 'Peltigera membranacea cyanobiont' N6]|uniref:RpoD/SigA family RNA polymerase sigma factor n=1 Tax=Nostoc sp. 'Peltigera membranacea cyanobiont' N6 TaxID=1261031 RepID=UPI000CF33356|nr:RpoD/SigA family RNA polymerase sigma factor [Nostoc sp. 'Peltigera membranacea cyanobiont' N6]AVH63519.1 RNA polymerase sigma factor [Nostoc sp. 'Peltigera membranacea cyanobiont' N6]